MDATNQFLEKYRNAMTVAGYSYLELRPRMICKDGFTMSVQASDGHYCAPREDIGPYSKVEVGFPDIDEETLKPYQDGDSHVYGYVPVEIVNAIIETHGGLIN